ncbi:unnamed protein product [Paramecium pentaurelia]|uniref:Uncharacterized protein n=1 Tax=Paramecium pentaurelia TaxID=43138 RepID=A0A8S1UVL5_9CILI|nr:unnamed protein product [Paramecium pentaurelia]
MMEQFGLSAEEEYYSFDEHLTYVKRRIFILIQQITIISKQLTLFQQNNDQYQQHQQQKQEQDDGNKKLALLKGGLNKFFLFYSFLLIVYTIQFQHQKILPIMQTLSWVYQFLQLQLQGYNYN